MKLCWRGSLCRRWRSVWSVPCAVPLLQPGRAKILKPLQHLRVQINLFVRMLAQATWSVCCQLPISDWWSLVNEKQKCLFCLAVSPAFGSELRHVGMASPSYTFPSLDSCGWVEVGGGTSVKHFKTLNIPSFCASGWLKNAKVMLAEPPLLNSACQG